MKDIKCRVWNITLKKIIYFDILHVMSSTGSGEKRDYKITSDGFHDDYLTWNECQYSDIMLCMGKDKNGKEIFEGDIVEGRIILYPNGEHIVVKSEVLWDSEKGRFYINCPFIEFFPEQFKVIGNKYEIPELLDEEIKQK